MKINVPTNATDQFKVQQIAMHIKVVMVKGVTNYGANHRGDGNVA